MTTEMSKDTFNIFFNKPAECWTEAFPLGNGHLGAMVYGHPLKEVIKLNHDTLWTGHPVDDNNYGSYKFFKEAQALAMEGKLWEAQRIIETKCQATWSHMYLPLGDIEIDFKGNKGENYSRNLNLKDSLATVKYDKTNIEYFISNPHKVMAVKIESEETLDFTIGFTCPLMCQVKSEGNRILADGECPGDCHTNEQVYHTQPLQYGEQPEEKGVPFRMAADILPGEGKCVAEYGKISVSGTNKAIIFISVETGFNGYDKAPQVEGKEYKNACLANLEKAEAMSFDEIKEIHILDVRSIFDRVNLDLGSNNKENVPTPERLIKKEAGEEDKGLYTLFYNFGRYLAIAGSREGSQAMNLQGIWNQLIDPPWRSNYTTNINTEMNYWPMLMCNMAELNMPLVEMIKDLCEKGKTTAKEHYGARGFAVHHNVDLWRHTVPVGVNFSEYSAEWSFWYMCGGWMARHLYEHYYYTMDKDFALSTAIPVMKEACLFCIDMMIEDKDGYLIIGPSTSPENVFWYQDNRIAVSQTTTMTMSIAKDVLTNFVKIAEDLGQEPELVAEIKDILPKLLPFKITSDGRLQEWYEEVPEIEPNHRHISHLYGLHPARLITPVETPELTEACIKSLEMRGDEGTGWSLGWKINVWARLLDGNHALKLLDRQLHPVEEKDDLKRIGGTYPNLMDAHPPFQIDGNFGAVSGITEMLMQSYDGKIYILPALPEAWKKGSVKGLKAWGNITVNIEWDNGELSNFELLGDTSKVKVCYKGQELKTEGK